MKMSKHLQNSLNFVTEYVKLDKKKDRIAVIKNAKKDNIIALIEIILNTLSGVIKVHPSIIQLLHPYKHLYRKILRFNSVNWKEARQTMSKSRNETAIHKIIKAVLSYITTS